MRFPSIADVAAELRSINKQQSSDDGDDGGIDVRLQVHTDGNWTVNWGSSDYDQDHRGYWGSSSVPGDNRRFDSKDIARDLIEQAREQKATGGDEDDGFEESAPRRVASRRQPSLPGHEDIPEKIEISIPNMPMWEQVDGDMSPDKYGGTIARSDGDTLELLKIQPVREYVGDDEAADVGFPFWTREASYDAEDLQPSKDEVRKALSFIGMSTSDLEDLKPKQRALAIACGLLDYGYAVDEGPAGWSKDIIHDEVKWASGKIAGSEYLEDEDDEFRREILGEDDEEEDEEDDEDEDEEEDE